MTLSINEILDFCYNLNLSPDERLSQVFKSITLAFSDRQFEKIDDLLGQYDPEQSDKLMNLAILRISFTGRSVMSNWFICRDKVKANLDLQGLESKYLMRGLLK